MKGPARIIDLRKITQKRSSAYRFVDRDPIIDELIAAMDASGKTDAEIAASAMCTWQTVNNIRVKTKRPQNYTVDRILKACGYRRVLVRIGESI